MNKRIQEIYKETTGKDWVYDFDPDYAEKFAELIVRECIQTLLDNTPERYTNESAEEDWDKGYDQAMRDCVNYIQENFGGR